jgi:hypothetical protein
MSKTAFVYHFNFPTGSGRGPYRYIALGRRVTSSGLDGETIPLAVGGGTFEHTPSGISHGRLVHERAVQRQTLTFSVPLSDPLAQDLAVNGVVEGISVTLFIVDPRDPIDAPAGRAVLWRGRVTGLAQKDTVAEISTENLMTRLRQEGNRARYSKTCRHALYGPGCNLDRTDFQESREVTSSTLKGRKLGLAELGGDFTLSGGMVNVGGVLYFILEYADGVATLDRPSGAAVGNTVTVHPGCRRTPEACHLFGNILNYGGFPFIPRDNPFQLTELV